MGIEWFTPRRYKHFDRPVGITFAEKVTSAWFVTRHPFTPLIRKFKETKRYKPAKGKTLTKSRPIMYASHRDACVLSYYASKLDGLLEAFYKSNKLDDEIIAYRKLGKSNADFSADAFSYAVACSPCAILAFDVSGFFDNLDHGLLKNRLKRILGNASLPHDWLKVLRFVTRFHFVEMSELKLHPALAAIIREPSSRPIATVAQVKKAGITIYKNSTPNVGIPQGTPISASLSNLYMMDFDVQARAFCQSIGALYRRYSDDILIICPAERVKEVHDRVIDLLKFEKLEISIDKTEIAAFPPSPGVPGGERCAQYLGFTYYPGGAGIRPSSLARQWRKMRRKIKRTVKIAKVAIANGAATRVYTKKLRRRFTPLKFRNFSSYARRSASAFGKGEKILRQVRRFERAFERELKKALGTFD